MQSTKLQRAWNGNGMLRYRGKSLLVLVWDAVLFQVLRVMGHGIVWFSHWITVLW